MRAKLWNRWRRFRAGQGPVRGWFCPGELELAAFLEGNLSGRTKERMVRHLADCDHCLAQVAELSRLRAEETAVPVPPALLGRARALAGTARQDDRRPLVRWGAFAAAAACVALVVVTTYHQPPPPPALAPSLPTTRPSGPEVIPDSATSPPVVTSQAGPRPAVRNLPKRASGLRLVHPREGATVAPGRIEFRWEDVPGALYYEVSVASDDGDVIWEGRAERAEASLPADIRMAAGQGFYVRVRAWLAEGKSITSGAVSFRVKEDN